MQAWKLFNTTRNINKLLVRSNRTELQSLFTFLISLITRVSKFETSVTLKTALTPPRATKQFTSGSLFSQGFLGYLMIMTCIINEPSPTRSDVCKVESRQNLTLNLLHADWSIVDNSKHNQIL